jgi:hypothetical protein
MAVRQKWDINGKGVAPQSGGSFSGYTGPDLPKGSWPAIVKRCEIMTIKSAGANKGKPRIRILLEVQTKHLDDESKHQYHGHPVWDGLNIIQGSEGYVNAFLHALTDGSQRAKNAVESAFWDEDKGPEKKRIKVAKGPREGEVETHITKIGRYVIGSPNGQTMVQITTKPGKNLDGDYRADLTGYIPYTGPSPKAADSEDDLDDEELDDDDDMIEDDVDDDEDYDDDVDDDDEVDEDEDEDEPVKGRAKVF